MSDQQTRGGVRGEPPLTGANTVPLGLPRSDRSLGLPTETTASGQRTSNHDEAADDSSKSHRQSTPLSSREQLQVSRQATKVTSSSHSPQAVEPSRGTKRGRESDHTLEPSKRTKVEDESTRATIDTSTDRRSSFVGMPLTEGAANAGPEENHLDGHSSTISDLDNSTHREAREKTSSALSEIGVSHTSEQKEALLPDDVRVDSKSRDEMAGHYIEIQKSPMSNTTRLRAPTMMRWLIYPLPAFVRILQLSEPSRTLKIHKPRTLLSYTMAIEP